MRVGAGTAFLFLLTGCPSSGTVSQPLSDAGPGHVLKPPPPHTSCAGDPTMCLSGTARLDGRFTATPTTLQVALFRLFPGGTEPPVSTQPVATDGTWAFSGLDPDAGANAALPAWSHYYVQAAAGFVDGEIAPSALVGPLAVPSSGAPIPISIPPAQFTVLESRLAADGGSLQAEWALSHVFDPKGREITPEDGGGGARVAILVGGTSIPLVWTTLSPGQGAYFAQLSPPLPAQATYSVTVSHPSLGDVGWQLVADPPTFDGTITAIDGGLLDGGPALTVSWAPEPLADYEVLEIYQGQDGGWANTPAYTSAQPNPPDQSSETLPIYPDGGLADAGTYLVNVAYSKTHCEPDAGGCVQASTVAAATMTRP